MYTINKGIGKSAEFKGLKGSAIFVFLIMVFFMFALLMVLQIVGVGVIKILITMVIYTFLSFGVLYWFVKKFGQNGFEKYLAGLKQTKKIRSNNPNCFQLLIQKNLQD
jgi:Domain of unknown function (DUF4133)